MFNRFRYRENHGRDGFDILHIPGLIYKAKGSEGGHVRLFKKPLGGLMIMSWNHFHPSWSIVRRWHLGPFATIVHVDTKGDTLKSVTRHGWHFRFGRIKIGKLSTGVGIAFLPADKGYSL